MRGVKPQIKKKQHTTKKVQSNSELAANPNGLEAKLVLTTSNEPLTVEDVFKTSKKALQELGIAEDADNPALMLLAIQYVIAMRALQGMDSLTREDENGVGRKHPLLQDLRDSTEQFTKLASEFGMTPVSRARLKVNPKALPDSFGEYLKT